MNKIIQPKIEKIEILEFGDGVIIGNCLVTDGATLNRSVIGFAVPIMEGGKPKFSPKLPAIKFWLVRDSIKKAIFNHIADYYCKGIKKG